MNKRVLFTFCMLWIVAGLYGQAFTNVAPSVGITGGYGMNSFFGAGGVSFVDFNMDGLDDLTFCTMVEQPMKFYLNTGTGFMLVNPPYVDNTLETRHALWADIDNDGDMDLFVTAYNAQSRLYRNSGSMTFTDITAGAGLPTTTQRTYGAVFADFDRDGFLDLYVTHYGLSPNGAPNFLYRNNGNLTFTDVTAATGTSNGPQQTFCATFFDYDNNGTSDLYVVNDRFEFPNALYSVSPNGTFTDISESSGTDIAVLAMNGGVGDYNNDGYLDIYVTNTNVDDEHCYLLHNNGDSTFTDSSALAGVTFDRFGWGGNFFDFDNDRDQDLYVCKSQTALNSDPNALFVNQGNGTFTEPLFASNGLGGIDTMNSYANAIGDYNNDGKPDIAVSNAFWGITDYPFLLWRNDVVNSNNWIKIKLVGHQSNRDAVGAMLQFWINGTKYIRFTHTANAYLAQNSKTITFGLGSATAIDSLKIIWPSMNSVDVIPGSQLAINQTHTIHESCNNTNVVTSTADIGSGTLRSVLGCAQEGDTIFFDNALAGDTIILTSQVLRINKDIVLYSTLSPRVTIASTISGVIEVMPNTAVEIHKVNILSGPSGNPAALQNSGDVDLFQTHIMRHPALPAGNKLVQNMGGIFVHGNCTVEQ